MHSIRWKLALSYIAISVLPLFLFYNLIVVSIEDYYVRDRIAQMRRETVALADNFSFYFSGGIDAAALQQVDAIADPRNRPSNYRILVFDKDLTVISGTNKGSSRSQIGNTLVVPEVIRALTERNEANLHRTEAEASVFSAAAIEDASDNKLGAVLIISSAEDIYDALDDINQQILYTILALALVVAVSVLFMSQALIVPLKNVLHVVQKMTDGHLNQRITLKGRDEYSQLASAFNTMTDMLEQVDKTREEFVSNVSHELKTPLSSMKVLSESLLLQESVPNETYREFLQDITSEVDRMTNIVNDLLALVKISQREHSLNIQPVELNRLVEDILKRLSPLAEQKKIVLLYEDVRNVVIDADEMKLSLAISNIVENGIKYTPGGGTVKVIVDADHQNAFITVHDTGIGIQEEEQGKIFNRFYRVDKTRDRETGGTGLGLSITHSTVLLHNGSIRLTSKPDEGSIFIVRLPIHQN
ncbi:MAG: cell wall metabolism sensor histidine kinase WalK [Clostridiales bacterium]|jgi:signal transduction histidine kinase|nr:cell wall metabolism sensor histidine kinase WalK [Clostridiales bacterium]